MKLKHLCLSATALSLSVAPVHAASAQASTEKPGSAYVQCDGQPNNVTSGETAARLLGAVTLLGLFAPPPESPDASKRKFAAAGVAACSSLLEGNREGNAHRRQGLILGRALHQIEAKNYDAALSDVALARHEAEAGGMLADPYFARSRARALAQVESAALLRMGRAEQAREVSLREVGLLEYSLFGLLTAPTFGDFITAPSDAEDKVNHWRSRLVPFLAVSRADRLDLGGRFADSARVRDAYVEFDSEHTPQTNSSVAIAQAAIAHALAGNAVAAAERASAARANSAKRKAEGSPENDAAEFVELMDLYNILETARSGDLKTARRLFAARSQWVGASLGSVMEVNRRLREGAAPDELIGGLSRTSEQLWKDHAEASRAALVAKDSDNKTLFYLMTAGRSAGGFHALSKNVWRTDKSKIIIKTKADQTKNRMELMYLPFVDPTIAMEAYVLHAALIARSRGQQGFVFAPILTDDIVAASFRTGNRNQKGFPDDLFIAADDVIAKLEPIIPQPATIKAQQQVKR